LGLILQIQPEIRLFFHPFGDNRQLGQRPLLSVILGGTLSDFGPKNNMELVRISINKMVSRFLIVGAAMFALLF
jgi:hypothetical protein